MSTREKRIENTERRPGDQPDTSGIREHVASLFGDARRLLEVARPVTARALSSDSEGFLDTQRQITGQ